MKSKILSYYRKEGRLLFIFLSTSFMVTILDLYSPILVSRLIDITIPEKNLAEFFRYSLILMAAYILRLLVGIISSSRGQLMGNRIKFQMREELFIKILNRSSMFFQKRKSGDLISRITGDLENVSALLYRGLEDLFFSILSIAGAMILMFRFDVRLTLLTMLPLPFALIFSINKNKKLKEGYSEIRKSVSGLTSSIHDTLRTIYFIKDNTLEKEKIKEFKEDNLNLLEAERKNIYNTSSLMSGINFYNQITQLIVIFVGGYFHIKGELTMGIIVSFILLTNRFRIYLMRLMGLIDVFQKGFAGIERFSEIMELEEHEKAKEKIDENIESINLENLSFSYGGNKIFENLNLTIKKGEKVAFVGESGVGKTTLLNLLKRNISPDEGRIILNSRDIREISREEYLKKMGIVDQNEHIMDKSLLDNIRIIKSDAEKSELENALELAFIKELDLKKEAGILSTGQKQRVALARLFLKNPDIILLDEATSALDNITEKNIMNNIQKVFKDKIIIAVAHKLNTLKDFDRIFLLKKNKVVEFKSYSEFREKGEII